MKKYIILVFIFILNVDVYCQKPKLLINTPNGGMINFVSLSKDEKMVAVGSDLSGINIWDLASNSKLNTLVIGNLEEDEGLSLCLKASFLNNNKNFFRGRTDKFSLWSINQPQPLLELSIPFTLYDISHDEKYIAVVSSSNHEAQNIEEITKYITQNTDSIEIWSKEYESYNEILSKLGEAVHLGNKKVFQSIYKTLPAKARKNPMVILGLGHLKQLYAPTEIIIYSSQDGSIHKKIEIPVNPNEQIIRLKFTYTEGYMNRLFFMYQNGEVGVINMETKDIEFQSNLYDSKSTPQRYEEEKHYNYVVVNTNLSTIALINEEFIDFYDWPSFQLKYKLPLSEYKEMRIIDFTPDGKHLYFVDKKIILINPSNKKKYTLENGISYLRNISFSNDKKFMAVGGYSVNPVKWQTNIYNIKLPKLTKVIDSQNLSFYPKNSRKILYSTINGNLIPANLEESKNTSEQPSKTIFSSTKFAMGMPVDFNTKHDKWLFWSGRLNIWDWSTLEMTIHPTNQFPGDKHFYKSPNQRFIAYTAQKSAANFQIDIMDFEEGKTFSIKDEGKLEGFEVSWNKNCLVALVGDSIHIYHIFKSDRINSIPIGYDLHHNSFKVLQDRLAYFDSSFNRNYWKILTIPTGEEISKVNNLILAYTPNARFYLKDTIDTYSDDRLNIYESGTNRLVSYIPTKSSSSYFHWFNNSSEKIALLDSDKVLRIYNLSSGQLEKELDINNYYNSGQFPFAVVDPTFSLIAVMNDANGIIYIDIETKNEVCEMYSTDKGYIIKTLDNYYMASKSSLNNIMSFKVGEQIYSFDQFDLKYNRPDLVLKRIGYVSKNTTRKYYIAYRKRLEKLNFTEEMLSNDFHVPQLGITTDNLPITTNNAQIRININATDTQQKLDRINVYINDIPIYGINGINLRNKNTQTWQQHLNLTLSKGENKIQVSALNQGGAESLKETIYITHDAPESKNNLYLIGLGIDNFNSPKFNLSYPTKDIKDLIKTYKNKTNQYNNIQVDTLLNQNITIQNLQAIKQKLQNSKVDDQVILFVAGHGILDDSLNYYFATHKTDFDNPSVNSIPYEELENLLDGIPARNKLFLMDACHSGEIDKEGVELVNTNQPQKENIKFRSFGKSPKPKLGLNNSFELMRELFVDLRRGTGATVISSASGVEFAWEGDQWNNSVFTYTLLSGLKEQKADLNKDGQIMVSELQEYLATEVPKLTNNHQRPTMRLENISNDWRVW